MRTLVQTVFLFAFIASLFSFPTLLLQAQTPSYLPSGVSVAGADETRAKLQAQLNDLESQIQAQQTLLDQTKGQDASLQKEIKTLNAKILEAKLQIQARDIAVQQLSGTILQKQASIHGLDAQLQKELESLASILRQQNEIDRASPLIAVLSSATLSDFFSDTNSFLQINTKMQDSFTKITSTKNVTVQQKDDLEDKLDTQAKLRAVQQLQQQQIASQQKQKQKVLADTKGQEKSYQDLITKTQKSAAQIRAALFQLSGSSAISFGRALDFANEASSKTGIRPAFLLGIITEESNLGENVGKGTYQVDMHPTRDVPVFKAITASLGLDPDRMAVSKKQSYGWGGAMGPAQFIPSTWVLYAGYVKPDYHYDQSKDRIGKLTGNTPPNPWNPEDAFMASALLLTDNGAGAQTPAAEFKAAMCYLAGCGNANVKSLQFYGEQVASYAADYQCQINVLQGKPLTPECNY